MKPVVYIFHGDDPLAIRRSIESLIEKMDEPSVRELNLSRLDGRSASDEELRSAANALPFLSERRLVILTNPFTRLNTDATRKRFLALLDGLPDSTALVLAVEDTFERGKWKSLPAVDANWMRKWIHAAGKRAFYQLCQVPPPGRMTEWVREEARRQGGQISPEAASALVEHVGNNTQAACQEITKLLTYVDYRRPVELADVQDLTAQTGQADVFEMVDALASGSGRQALRQLHRLLETQEPLSLFGMITRQFRLLIQARELIDEGRAAYAASEMHLPNFVVEKLIGQARRFSMPRLEVIYHRLLELDEVMKTSQMPSDLALDTFVVEVTG